MISIDGSNNILNANSISRGPDIATVHNKSIKCAHSLNNCYL